MAGQQLFNIPLAKGVFVDLTAEETDGIILDALEAGMNVVVADKKPLCFDKLASICDLAWFPILSPQN